MTYKELEELLEKNGCNGYGLTSTMEADNQDGERVFIRRYEDAIVTETAQKNGWIRKNVYHKDGTIEEDYTR